MQKKLKSKNMQKKISFLNAVWGGGKANARLSYFQNFSSPQATWGIEPLTKILRTPLPKRAESPFIPNEQSTFPMEWDTAVLITSRQSSSSSKSNIRTICRDASHAL